MLKKRLANHGQAEDDEENFMLEAPVTTGPSHARAASPCPHARLKIEIEVDCPVEGQQKKSSLPSTSDSYLQFRRGFEQRSERIFKDVQSYHCQRRFQQQGPGLRKKNFCNSFALETSYRKKCLSLLLALQWYPNCLLSSYCFQAVIFACESKSQALKWKLRVSLDSGN